jgi:hypothetical protein
MDKRCDHCLVLYSTSVENKDCSCGGHLFAHGDIVNVEYDGKTEKAMFVKFSGTAHRIVRFSNGHEMPLHPNDKMEIA